MTEDRRAVFILELHGLHCTEINTIWIIEWKRRTQGRRFLQPGSTPGYNMALYTRAPFIQGPPDNILVCLLCFKRLSSEKEAVQHGRGYLKVGRVGEGGEISPVKFDWWKFLLFNVHSPSGFGGAALVLLVLGLSFTGYILAKVQERRKTAARRAATSLEILKTPV